MWYGVFSVFGEWIGPCVPLLCVVGVVVALILSLCFCVFVGLFLELFGFGICLCFLFGYFCVLLWVLWWVEWCMCLGGVIVGVV